MQIYFKPAPWPLALRREWDEMKRDMGLVAPVAVLRHWTATSVVADKPRKTATG